MRIKSNRTNDGKWIDKFFFLFVLNIELNAGHHEFDITPLFHTKHVVRKPEQSFPSV